MKIPLKDFLPPVLLKYFGRYHMGAIPFLPCISWEEAKGRSNGYDSDRILEKVRDSLLKVKNGEAIYERDSVLFDKVQYSWPLLAGLLWIASRKDNRLNLLDFGGSLGSTYFQTRKFLSHLKETRWNIVEQKKFVECGKRDFEIDHLKFFYDLDACFREQHPDTILFSGVIQYLEDPYGMLEKAMSLGFEFVLFDRTPFLEKGGDRITIQKVPDQIFPASFPCWFLSQERFLETMGDRYELFADFEGFDRADVQDSVFKGFIFRRK
jgi:putative methyltransferase (TIGR04325 family)